MTPVDPKGIRFGGPAKYMIVVQGTVDSQWSDRLGGMSMTCPRQDDEYPCTTLVGWIHDQAELKGILDTLYGLHCPILKIDAIPETD